jgi:cellulose synthase/poly-beta-1,6-N-acetylglucosamine synthase-like glycosyltransferase
MLPWLFWISVFMVAYPYVVYPAVLWLLAFWRRPRRYADPAGWPDATLIICAYNEAKVIGGKLDNSLALDYPADKLEILVISDCSDDGTDDIAASFAERGVRLHRVSERGGKTAAQNAAVRLARGGFLVFSDANSLYDPGALKALMRPFTDPKVGCVCGELHYTNPNEAGAAKGEGVYWRYEQLLKRGESRLSSLVGANGSIYAMRYELFDELGPNIISDFIMPIRIWRKRYKVVYAPQAVAYESSGESFSVEFRRRTRIIARSLYGLWSEVGALNPLRYGFFSFQLLSHKLLRWLAPLFLILAFVTNGLLVAHEPYGIFFAAQAVFYALALVGNLAPGSLGRIGLFYIPAYFCAINFGALVGLWRFVSGERFKVWQPINRA